jgi:mono/diheme cytochrome c family protein
MIGKAVQLALAAGCAGLLSQALADPGYAPVLRTPPVQASYMLNCMGCHLADGSGAPGKVPSLRDSLARLAMSAAGRRYLVQVPGASQSALTNAELARLLSWMVRDLSAAGAPRGFKDFTTSEVAGYRGTPLLDARAMRARLLRAPRRSGA